MREAKRHTMAKDVRATPNQAQRSQSGAIEYLKRVKLWIDRLRAFKMQNDRDHIILQTGCQLSAGADNFQLSLRCRLEPEYSSGHRNSRRLGIARIQRR